jgi:hypothetical protein
MQDKIDQAMQDFEDEMDGGDWKPTYGPSKKQKTPNMIRAAIRKYISDNNINQTEFLRRIGVNSNSFGKFMTMKYKDEWSAVQNGTYWSAARFLAMEEVKQKIITKEEKVAAKDIKTNKRTLDDFFGASAAAATGATGSASAVAAPAAASIPTAAAKKSKKAEIEAELLAISSVDVHVNCAVFANCDEVRLMLHKYLLTSGVTDGAWLRTIGAQTKSLKSFRGFKGKGAGASNQVYQKAWRFFEQKRILEGQPKSAKRLEQEARWGPQGFDLRHDSGTRYVFGDGPTDDRIFDIEYIKDMQNNMNRSKSE